MADGFVSISYAIYNLFLPLIHYCIKMDRLPPLRLHKDTDPSEIDFVFTPKFELFPLPCTPSEQNHSDGFKNDDQIKQVGKILNIVKIIF